LSKVELDPREIEIPKNVLKARLGFGRVREIPPAFEKYVREAYEELLEVATPVVFWEDFEAKSEDGKISFDGLELSGKLVEAHLLGSKLVTVFLATLGEGVDEKIEEHFARGEDLMGFFLDGIASEMVEYALRRVDATLRTQRPHLLGGFRVSPGYVDLPLELNERIVKMFEGQVDVRVVQGSYVLVPRKTITAFLGWRERDAKEI